MTTYLFHENKLYSQVPVVQAELITTKEELLGYTKYADYMAAVKHVLSEQERSLATKVIRSLMVATLHRLARANARAA